MDGNYFMQIFQISPFFAMYPTYCGLKAGFAVNFKGAVGLCHSNMNGSQLESTKEKKRNRRKEMRAIPLVTTKVKYLQRIRSSAFI